MQDWNFSPPPPSNLGDHDVPLEGKHLQGKRIALLITGGIAAMKAPLIARSLRREGAEVVAFTSSEALRYVTIDALEWSTNQPVITKLTSAAEHISDKAPFAAYIVAPATYNTINKFRYGIADGVITSTLASALGRMEQEQTKIMIVPTMHGSLHNSILTESLQTLDKKGVKVMTPREDYGKHNIPNERDITGEFCRLVSNSSLKDIPILVTGGPTPVIIDNVRRLTNKFSGQLGANITEELYLRGADVQLIHGRSSYTPANYLPYTVAETYADYLSLVRENLAEKVYKFAIFSAAVADYQPEKILPGKTPSGTRLNLKLVPTLKVIDEVKNNFPDLSMIIFKYQEQVSHEELMNIAYQRIKHGYLAVVANRGEESEIQGEQVAYLVTDNQPPQKMIGKKNIAIALADYLESLLTESKLNLGILFSGSPKI
jgi:phosphopantothenoylcysteine decarboxylase/phosphopantothenate--cysteine ligase